MYLPRAGCTCPRCCPMVAHMRTALFSERKYSGGRFLLRLCICAPRDDTYIPPRGYVKSNNADISLLNSCGNFPHMHPTIRTSRRPRSRSLSVCGVLACLVYVCMYGRLSLCLDPFLSFTTFVRRVLFAAACGLVAWRGVARRALTRGVSRSSCSPTASTPSRRCR